jgi:hypothetical protein
VVEKVACAGFRVRQRAIEGDATVLAANPISYQSTRIQADAGGIPVRRVFRVFAGAFGAKNIQKAAHTINTTILPQ